MLKRIILAFSLAAMIGVSLVLHASLAGAADEAGAFSITDQTSTGYVIAENDAVKVVWHYKTLSEENLNRGGGSIYELYDKRTDPAAQNNLVALYDRGGGETTPNMPGIGGLGATHMWELGRSVSASDNARYSRLVSQANYIDEEGNAVFTASFIVKSSLLEYASNEAARPDNYRVDKKWTVHPAGQIRLDIGMTILRDVVAAEPAYDFSFSQDYGFTTASSVGHKWNAECDGVGSNGNGDANNKLQTIENIDSTPDYDHQLIHSEFFSLYGNPNGSTVRVKMDNEGRGFENGGLFALGNSVWGDVRNATVEYSKYSDAAYGHTLRYFGWWGGAPPSASRHKLLSAGTAWSDTVWIELYPTGSPELPQTLGEETVDQLTPGSASLQWDTNVAADSRITLRKEGEAGLSQSHDVRWTPSHKMLLSGLVPGATYSYEARSGDGSGDVLVSGSFTAMTATGLHLQLSGANAYWESFSDFQNRLLTVDFTISNLGTESAREIEVLQATANRANAVTIFNPALGEIVPGGEGVARIIYAVPDGVASFNANIYLKVLDVGGAEYFIPSRPRTS